MTSTGTKRKISEISDDRCVTKEECQIALKGLSSDNFATQDGCTEFEKAVATLKAAVDILTVEEPTAAIDSNIRKRVLHYVDLGVDTPLTTCDRCKPGSLCKACTEYTRRMRIADQIGAMQKNLLREILDKVYQLFETSQCGKEHDLFLGSALETGAKVKPSASARGSIRMITKQRVNRLKLRELNEKRTREIMKTISDALGYDPLN